MKKTRHKIMLGVIFKMFIVLLTSIVNAYNHTILMNAVKNFNTIQLRLN